MKAIDIAILMPSNIERLIKKINTSQPESERKYVYTDTWPYPHISLFMWALNDDDVLDMKTKLENSWVLDSNFCINTWGIQLYKNKINEIRYFIEVAKSKELMDIQDRVIILWNQYLGRTICRDMYIDSDEVSESSMHFCENYNALATWENFHPHISLGIWKPSLSLDGFAFEASRLVIGQMWPSWTVREILYEFTLW